MDTSIIHTVMSDIWNLLSSIGAPILMFTWWLAILKIFLDMNHKK